MIARVAPAAAVPNHAVASLRASPLFNQPKYLTLDSAGNLLVSDTGNALVRKITPDGAATILALIACPFRQRRRNDTSP